MNRWCVGCARRVERLHSRPPVDPEFVFFKNKLPVRSRLGVGVREHDKRLLVVGREPHLSDGVSVFAHRIAIGELSPKLLLTAIRCATLRRRASGEDREDYEEQDCCGGRFHICALLLV